MEECFNNGDLQVLNAIVNNGKANNITPTFFPLRITLFPLPSLPRFSTVEALSVRPNAVVYAPTPIWGFRWQLASTGESENGDGTSIGYCAVVPVLLLQFYSLFPLPCFLFYAVPGKHCASPLLLPFALLRFCFTLLLLLQFFVVEKFQKPRGG